MMTSVHPVLPSRFADRRSRFRGFTLIEMLMALVLTFLLAGAVLPLVKAAARLQETSTSRLDRTRRAATVTALLRHESRGITGAVAVVDPDQVYLARRVAEGPVCARGYGGEALVPVAEWTSSRVVDPARDEITVLSDAGWTTHRLVSVGSSTCPGGVPALLLALSPPAPALPAVAMAREPSELRRYTSADGEALGLRSLSGGTVQPLLAAWKLAGLPLFEAQLGRDLAVAIPGNSAILPHAILLPGAAR